MSRVVRNLATQGLVTINDRLIRANDPDLLLNAWLEVYDFSKHERIAGHVPARDGDDLLRRLADALSGGPSDPPYAATGLAAAWCLGRFATFRTASAYVREEPRSDVLRALSFRHQAKGANVWLMIQNDEGVLQGMSTHDGIHCVNPVQVYLDLNAHSERGKDVAPEIKARFLNWDTG